MPGWCWTAWPTASPSAGTWPTPWTCSPPLDTRRAQALSEIARHQLLLSFPPDPDANHATESADVTGRVFEVEGGKIRVAEGWAHGPQIDKGGKWDPAELGAVVSDLLGKARTPVPVYGA